MTDITLYGRLSSANVQKAVWALEELELDYELEERGGRFGGVNDPAYLAMNPNGLVPTLRDGTLVVWESHAIVRYLSAEYADGLLSPTIPRDRALADQWTDWTATRFQPAWIGVFWSGFRTRAENRNPDTIAGFRAEAAKCFAIMDRQLQSSPFLAGDELTYADIVAGIALYRWTTMGTEAPLLPAVAAWHELLRQRPAFVKAVEVPYAELKDTL